MHKEDDKFDMMIRSILDEGQEEVPARVWDSINSRLDSIETPVTEKKTKPVIIWLRNTGIGLAAAAAVATAVIFNGINKSNTILQDNTIAVVENPDKGFDGPLDSISPEKAIMADAMATCPVSGKSHKYIQKGNSHNIPDNLPVTSITMAEAALDAEASDNNSTTGINKEETTASEKKVPTDSQSSEKKRHNTDSDYILDNPFDDFPEETDSAKHKVKAALTISGNANSNSNSERAKDLVFRAPGVPSKSTVTESGDSRYGIPLSFGIGTRLTFTKHWSMSIGINYTFLSRTFDGNFYDVKEDGTYTNTHFTDIRNTQNYIGIPLNIYYSVVQGRFVDFYAYAGGSAEYCLNNKYNMSSTDGNLTHKGDAGSFQFSANIGIGVEFIIAQRLGIYIDPSVRYYFRNSRAPKSIRTDQPLMLAFEAGLRIRF